MNNTVETASGLVVGVAGTYLATVGTLVGIIVGILTGIWMILQIIWRIKNWNKNEK